MIYGIDINLEGKKKKIVLRDDQTGEREIKYEILRDSQEVQELAIMKLDKKKIAKIVDDRISAQKKSIEVLNLSEKEKAKHISNIDMKENRNTVEAHVTDVIIMEYRREIAQKKIDQICEDLKNAILNILR